MKSSDWHQFFEWNVSAIASCNEAWKLDKNQTRLRSIKKIEIQRAKMDSTDIFLKSFMADLEKLDDVTLVGVRV